MFPSAIEKAVALDGHLDRDMGVVSGHHDHVPAVNGSVLLDYLPLSYVSAEVKEPVSGATKLRKMLLETNELIVCPGVYDGLSARTAIELRFDAMYMVCSKQCSVSHLQRPRINLELCCADSACPPP